ncbi:MAG: hypothetical protein V4623_10415, partial [Pseudomonadota bacterium]
MTRQVTNNGNSGAVFPLNSTKNCGDDLFSRISGLEIADKYEFILRCFTFFDEHYISILRNLNLLNLDYSDASSNLRSLNLVILGFIEGSKHQEDFENIGIFLTYLGSEQRSEMLKKCDDIHIKEVKFCFGVDYFLSNHDQLKLFLSSSEGLSITPRNAITKLFIEKNDEFISHLLKTCASSHKNRETIKIILGDKKPSVYAGLAVDAVLVAAESGDTELLKLFYEHGVNLVKSQGAGLDT